MSHTQLSKQASKKTDDEDVQMTEGRRDAGTEGRRDGGTEGCRDRGTESTMYRVEHVADRFSSRFEE
jgi:hypothetical protein